MVLFWIASEKVLTVSAGFFFKRRARYGHAVAGNLHQTFRAGEEKAFTLFAAVHEVDVQGKVEALRIIKERKQHVVRIAPILPEAQAASGHGAGGAVGAGNEVRAAEEMHEEIAGYAGPIIMPLAPLEEALGRPWHFRRGAFEARPVAGLSARVGRYRVVPCARSKNCGPSER